MISYIFHKEHNIVEISPKVDQPLLINELRKEYDWAQIQRLCTRKDVPTYSILFLFNRCQPQDQQFELRAPLSFMGSRVPYFGPYEQITENAQALHLWFVLEHSDSVDVNYRYVGRLLERELYQERHKLRRHKSGTWFFGHRLVRDCLSLDGPVLHLASQDSTTAQEKQQALAAPFQTLTRTQFQEYCADDLRAFVDADSGFLQGGDRQDVDHYLCFVAFHIGEQPAALALLKTATSIAQYSSFRQIYNQQMRECRDIATDAAAFIKFRDFLKARSAEFHRLLKAQVQKLRAPQMQASPSASTSTTRTVHVV